MSHHLLWKKSVVAVALTLGSSQGAKGAPIPRAIITGSNIAKIDSETTTRCRYFAARTSTCWA